MKRIAIAGVLSSLLALGVADVALADVNVAVGVQAPGFGAVITTGPTYAPYPVYVPYPAYPPPPPVYAYAYPAPRYVYARPGRGYGHYKHHKRFKHGRGCR